MDTFKYPVKIHPGHESNNVQEELALNSMTPTNADSQRCYKSDDIEMIDKEIQWIQNNISMRVCTTFVPKDDRICHCGYEKSYHTEVQSGKWDEQQHTKTEPTNAFGKIEFQGFGQKIGRYVRVDYKTDMDLIIDLIKNQWKLHLPNLLISVTGGAKNFQMKPQLKEVFRRGLVKVARSTGAWVTSAGLNAGVMKHVGEAIRDYGFTLSGRDKVVAIGIAPWGCVQNKDNLIDKNGMWPAQYDIKETSQEGVSPLDPNHSHFILVDNGTQYIFGTEIEFRANLERRIANEKISEAADVTIPAVVVMVEGGPGTLKTVYNSVLHNNPVIIVKGSGRAADIMAYAYQNAIKSDEDEFNKEGIISDQLKEDLKEKIIKEFGEKEVEKLFNFVRDSLKNLNLITVFEMGSKDSARDIDMSVLKALLKARENKLENLRLILEWNRIDVAKSEIFTDETQWPTGMLDNLMFSALLLDRVDFVKLFLEYGVGLKTFLTKDCLEKLYQETKRTPLQESLFNNGNKDNGKTINIKKVADVINDLMGDDYFQYSYYHKNNEPKEKYSFPANELFLWAVLMNRREMAFLFWKEGMEGLPAALVANRLLKAMKQRSRDYDQINKLQGHADLFEERAIGVLTECYASDEKMALQLLVQQRDNWGQTSCILIAVNADNKRFISQTACQSLLSNIWMGKMNNSNSNWKLIVSILFPLFILLLITFDKKNSEKDQGSESGKKKGSKNEAENLSRKQKILAFYTAPVITFITNVGFYVIFLIIFSYVLLVEFQNTTSNMEYLLYIWVFAILTEELRQMYFRSYVKAVRHQVHAEILAKYSSSIRIKIANYFTDIWNIVDIINILLFLIGITTRYFEQLDNARVVLCVNLILFYFRVLHIFSVHKELGPKLVMIKKMVQDLIYFVAILFVFMVAYGIASQAILYPSTPFSIELLKGVLKKPYFQMYGELFLSEIEGEECNESSVPVTFEHNNGLRKCPTEIGIKIVPVMMGVYILLTNILLLNLLIAMFSNTFQKVQDNTDLHWHFQRFGLISEYDTRPPLPPPFILLSHIYLLFCVIIRKFKAQENKDMAFKKNLSQIEKQLMHWEDEMADCYVRKKEKFENNSMEGKVSITSDRTEQMMMKIEELQHQQQHFSTAPNLPVTQLAVPTAEVQSLLLEIRQIRPKLESQLQITERLREVENQIKELKEMLIVSQSSTQEK